MAKLKNHVTLVLGDWSHDGHGWTQNVYITSNLTRQEIEIAYAKGVENVRGVICFLTNSCGDSSD